MRAFRRPLEAGHAGVGLGAASRAPRETPGERRRAGRQGQGSGGRLRGEAPGRRTAREALKEGAVRLLAGCAED